MTLTQLQERAVSDILAIRPVTRRGSGYAQTRTRRRILSRYRIDARRLGYTDAQIEQQIVDVRDMVELDRSNHDK